MSEQSTIDHLPPVMYLIMEVLAARHRLGESEWTFPAKLRPQILELERRHAVTWQNGVTPWTLRVRLTDLGRKAVLSPSYEPPGQQQPSPGAWLEGDR